MTTTPAEISALDMQLHIDATPEAVWDCLTSDIASWWPAEFFAGGSDGKRRFGLEPMPGGRMYEEWEDGGGILWGTVVTADPAKRLQVTGYTFPNWGGPNQWFGDWELAEKDGGTQLSFREHVIGQTSDDAVAEKDKAWQFLWQALKAKIEGQPAPVWSD